MLTPFCGQEETLPRNETVEGPYLREKCRGELPWLDTLVRFAASAGVKT
jgi:hypothetical protein